MFKIHKAEGENWIPKQKAHLNPSSYPFLSCPPGHYFIADKRQVRQMRAYCSVLKCHAGLDFRVKETETGVEVYNCKIDEK